MNLVSGEIVEIYIDERTTMGKVRVGGVFLRVPLFFLPETKVHDSVLIASGVAISTIETEKEKES